MPTCPAGSSPKPTAPVEVWITEDMLRTAMGTTVAAQLPRPTWAFAQQLYSVASLCSTPPPDPPVITDGDILLAQSNPVSWLALMNKVGAWRDAWAFSQYCQCNSTLPTGFCTSRTGTFVNDPGSPTGSGCAGGPWSYYQLGGDVNYRFPTGQHHVQYTMAGTAPQGMCISHYSDVSAEGLTHVNAGDPIVFEADFPNTATYWQIAFRGDVYHASDIIGRGVTLLYKNAAGEAACSGATVVGPPSPPGLPNTPVQVAPTGCTTDQLCAKLDEILWILQHSDGNQQVQQSGVQEVINNTTTTLGDAVSNVVTNIGSFFKQHSNDEFGWFNPTSGPTCDLIDVDISNAAYWGLRLNITTRPERYNGMTPDNEWSIADLAVIRLELNGELLARHPVHMNTYVVEPLPRMDSVPFLDHVMPTAPSGYHVIVQWALGVCGSLELQYIPDEFTPP